jgi:hypothetical protein
MARVGKLVLFILGGVYFYELITLIDKVTDTEKLFPNTDGILVAAIFLGVMGFITMVVAFSKGRIHRAWTICGTLFPPIPLLLLMILRSKPRVEIFVGRK